MLVRYLLEKCKTTKEAIKALKKIPIASAQTLTLADSTGDIVVVECNCKMVEIIKPKQDENFVTIANQFHSEKMKNFNNYEIDDWKAEERYCTAYQTLKKFSDNYSLNLMMDILSGKHGFMCTYDRKLDADTVWSVIYDVKNRAIYRVEGNPSRKKFKKDMRMKFKES